MTTALSSTRRRYRALVRGGMYLAAGLTGALTLFLVVYVLLRGLPNLSWAFISTKPSYLSGTIGILPDILTPSISSLRLSLWSSLWGWEQLSI